ncbi:MAG TPA: polysaccharide deacetylase family protein [Pirellulaceae bacterium]|nr:polysaccharide deacetylase family protein [Pirellulaceae bacterium]HMO94006.1 polysaccharide deacetylase family protein [Pirellulaceae bacterium]HMP70879.1 polysaccharide deacetylase family protein [Pirellulaceae bacterium]
MLAIESPIGCKNELDYIFGVIFGDWLGVPWTHVQTERSDVIVTLSGHRGAVRTPHRFFAQFAEFPENWLNVTSVPQLPLATYDARKLDSDILMTAPRVPIVFGDDHADTSPTDVEMQIPIDVFGSAFFMLTRYEEACITERDEHDRFPATASLAFKADFLERPIIDEYVEILWAAMQKVWPSLQRRQRQARILVSCDVDRPFTFDGSLKKFARRFAGDLLKRRSPKMAWGSIWGSAGARRGRYEHDPFRNGLKFIMDVNERAGRAAAFYFIPEKTDATRDQSPSLDEPRMRELIREIRKRGHEIGLHPGFNTYKHPEAMTRTVQTLRRVLDEEQIDQPQLGGRQHYLRWENPTTAQLWEQNKLDYDSTLSYADRPGFRCGTCHEYQMYDVRQRRPLNLRQRPLILMECTVIEDCYMGLGYSSEALSTMVRLKQICQKFSGDFSILWHNSHFDNRMDFEFYQQLVST